jgi:hypothetical protein
MDIIREIFTLKPNIYNILRTTDILFNVLDKKDEKLFYFLIGLFKDNDYNELFNNLVDSELNTLYHYICKNNICLGFKINNKFRNNKGFKPLDLCMINIKYYKL